MYEELKKGDKLYYARILPRVGVYEVIDLTVVNIYETYIATVDQKLKRRYLFFPKSMENELFINRKDALLKVLEAEEHDDRKFTETYYEEY